MSEHKEQIKKEISVQWDQFTTVNNLQYIENIGLLRRPSFSLAALGFSKYETLISQLKVLSIAYIHDVSNTTDLYFFAFFFFFSYIFIFRSTRLF